MSWGEAVLLEMSRFTSGVQGEPLTADAREPWDGTRRVEPDLSRFKTRPTGDEGIYIAVPEAGRAYFEGTTIPAVGARYVKTP